MMRAPLAASLMFLLAGAATPALATGSITCEGENVTVDLLVGRLPVLSVLRAVITIGDRTWSTEPGVVAGEPVAVGQAFEGDGRLLLDLTDEGVSEVVGRLRAYTLEEGKDFVSGGVFSMKGEGAFLVDCSLRG